MTRNNCCWDVGTYKPFQSIVNNIYLHVSVPQCKNQALNCNSIEMSAAMTTSSFNPLKSENDL